MLARTDSALTLGRIAGAPVRVGPGAAVLGAFFAFQLGQNWAERASSAGVAWGIAVATGLGFMLSILAHEAAHALMARRRGVEVTEIRLWLLGGSAAMSRSAPEPRSEVLISGAGPFATLVIGASLLVGGTVLDDAVAGGAVGALDVGAWALVWLGRINLILGVFNLVPGLPLDGGRVLTGMLWKRSGDRLRALTTVVKVSKGLAYVAFALAAVEAVYLGSTGAIFTAYIGMMFLRGGDPELAAARLSSIAGGRTVGHLARFDAPTIAQDVNTASARALLPAPGAWRWVAVVDENGVARGILDLVVLQRAAEVDGRNPVFDVMEPIDHHRAAYASEPMAEVLDRNVRPPFVVIDQAWRPVGIVDSLDRLVTPSS